MKRIWWALSVCVWLIGAPAWAAGLLIDVRSAEEFAGGHAAGAINLPLDRLGDTIVRQAPDKTAPIALYCRSGRRAAVAEQQLRALGYRDVRNLGGLDAVLALQAAEAQKKSDMMPSHIKSPH